MAAVAATVKPGHGQQWLILRREFNTLYTWKVEYFSQVVAVFRSFIPRIYDV